MPEILSEHQQRFNARVSQLADRHVRFEFGEMLSKLAFALGERDAFKEIADAQLTRIKELEAALTAKVASPDPEKDS